MTDTKEKKAMGGMRRITAATVLMVLVLLGACSSSGDDVATGTDTSTEVAEASDDSTDTTEDADSTDDTESTEADGGGEADEDGDMATFCASFPELGGRGGESEAYTAEQWEVRIATTEAIAESAPEEISAQADAYAEMMQLRAELAAENDYAAATDLPADVRQAFVDEAGGLQVQVNELIAYAREECNLDGGG